MWERLFAFSGSSLTPSTAPDVVILNIGIWAATWASLSTYTSGLSASLDMVAALAEEHGFAVLWRETTALFPRAAHDAPLYQINPRVQRLNKIASALARERGFELVPAYEMTAARADAARECVIFFPFLPRLPVSTPRVLPHVTLASPPSFAAALLCPPCSCSVLTRLSPFSNAHVAPWVQGDLAELLLYGVCQHVLGI